MQRLQMNDVVLIDLPEQGGVVEAKVMRDIDRTDTTVRVVLRVVGNEENFLKEWPIGERVTVVFTRGERTSVWSTGPSPSRS